MIDKQSQLHSPNYNEKQMTLLAMELTAVVVVADRWFRAPPNETPPDRFMNLLLMHVYLFSMLGQPLGKKDAWRRMALGDIKTGRKYIARAHRQGFIEVYKSPNDRRVELLYPSAELRRQAEARLRMFASQIRNLLYFLMDFPLTDDGPSFVREEPAEKRWWSRLEMLEPVVSFEGEPPFWTPSTAPRSPAGLQRVPPPKSNTVTKKRSRRK